MTEPRVTTTVRLGKSGIAAIDQLADQEDRTRSQMVRILLAEALKARGKQQGNVIDMTATIHEEDLRTDIHRDEAGASVQVIHLPTGLQALAFHRYPLEAKRLALLELAEAIKARGQR